MSSNSGTSTSAALRRQRIEWVVPKDKNSRLNPDWVAVDDEVEIVYRECHPDEREPKPLVYAVGVNKISQKWKSEWLATPSDAAVKTDPWIAMKTTPTKSVAFERLLPLNQVATYCRYAETRYAFILTQRELVALRIRRIPGRLGGRINKHHAAVEYAPVSLTASTGLTANLAIWALACLGMNDEHRAMEKSGNMPPDSMARVTWWKFSDEHEVYENVVSKRRIPQSEWKSEYGQFVHLTEKEGRSFTEAFLSGPQPLPRINTATQPMKVLTLQPPPPTTEAATMEAATTGGATTGGTTRGGTGPSTAEPRTKQVYINKKPGPCTATYHKATGKWVVTHQGQTFPIVRDGRKSVINMHNGTGVEVEDAT
ncbi:uncharacterized protein B0H64DRAFT_444086 [Chaetomium fimeti]|uniref:Uncharacterized protein n=1 Tax=Chaetomium fimeti TaxID=1854472 RepID=A0AAE0HET2_9PEZI|nr:hypothetical protein B0H64DRAFT_444086 [Chaetomium fimeti]